MFCAGLVLALVGIALWSVAAALVCAGVCCAVCGLFIDGGKRN